MKTRIKQFAVASTALLAAAAFAYQATATMLYKDGLIVSSNLKLMNGTLYVPVRDVATFLGGTLNVSGDRADIQTPAGTPSTTAGLAQTIEQEVAPSIAMPASAIATGVPSPPPAPTELTASLNQDVTFEGFAYRVTDIQYRNGDYKDQFDQRGTKLHSQWKADKLAIVSITVRNVGSLPGSPTIPGVSGFSIFDAQKVGYPTTAIDIQQAPAVLGGDFYDDTTSYATPLSFLAPGGKLSYAVIGSLPKSGSVTMVRFHLDPPSFPDVQPTPQPALVTTAPPPSVLPTQPHAAEPAVQNPAGPSLPSDFNPSGADVTINIS